MTLQWITYAAAGERLGISPEAVRQRAIRHEWSRRTGNDGRAEIRIDLEELLAAQPSRPPSEPPSDASPTSDHPAVEPLADARTLDVLDAHIATLRAMVARADERAEQDRERAADERARADAERSRADCERDRADAVAADLLKVRADGAAEVAGFDARLVELRALVDTMRSPATPPRPWWSRLALVARG